MSEQKLGELKIHLPVSSSNPRFQHIKDASCHLPLSLLCHRRLQNSSVRVWTRSATSALSASALRPQICFLSQASRSIGIHPAMTNTACSETVLYEQTALSAARRNMRAQYLFIAKTSVHISDL